MSALVWSVESAILGVWALVCSLYSTPFHAFIARSHCMIAGFNLVLQVISTARGLEISHAVSEAFVCATTALLLVYISSILDTANHQRLFSMPSAGILPLDAAIGIAWFCAALTSAVGMALSGVKQNQQRAALMFHQYGYHISIVLPSLLMLWLYNYDATNSDDPVYKGIKLARNNSVTITHTLIFTMYACIWGWFVLAQFLGEGLSTAGGRWLAWQDMTCGTSVAYVTAVVLKFLGRCGCVLIPLSATFVTRTYAQTMTAWVLVGVAGAYAIDLLGTVEFLLGFGPNNPPQKATIIREEDSTPSAPPMEPTAPPMAPAPTEFGIQLRDRIDPAAFILTAHATLPTVSSRPQQWTRDKMV